MMTVGRIRQLALAMLFFCAADRLCAADALLPSAKPGEPITVDADKVSFEENTHTATGEGNAVVRYAGATLRADHIKLDTVTKDAWAEGNVRLNRGGEEWVVPAAQYNFATHYFEARNLRGFVSPVILGAESIRSVSSNEYEFTRGTVSTCDYEHPHYRWEATHGEVLPNNRVVMYNCTLRLGDVPVFWLPVMVWDVEGNYPPFVFTAGKSSRWGYYALSSTYWKFDEHWRMGVHVDERTRRGVAGGLDLSFDAGRTGGGMLRGYYAADQGADAGIEGDRYRFQWRHRQALRENLTLTADMNKLSDAKFVQDFFPLEFALEREPDNVVDLTLRTPNATASLLARPQVNEFFAEVQRLPEAKLAINRTRIGSTPLYYEGETSAAQLNNDPGDTGDAAFAGHSPRVDSFHQLVLPHTFFGWLSVVPRAGVRGTWYLNGPATAPDTNEISRVVYAAGVDGSFKLTRTWPGVQNRRWRIDGLRHVIEPFADYQWIPEPNVASTNLFQFDTLRQVTLIGGDRLSVTRYSPIDFPAFNSIDSIEGQNLVRFGVRQRFQTRRDGRPWDLVELTGWTDWRIEREAGERDFADLFGTLRLRPAEWIASEVGARYDFNNEILRELNTGTSVFNRDRWRVSVTTRYLRGDSNTIGLSQFYQVAPHWSFFTVHRFDFADGFLEEQQYGIKQELHDWYLDYGVLVRGERVKSDEFSVYVAFTLKAFPGFRLSAARIDVSSNTDESATR